MRGARREAVARRSRRARPIGRRGSRLRRDFMRDRR
jgi:hypothetical protein